MFVWKAWKVYSFHTVLVQPDTIVFPTALYRQELFRNWTRYTWRLSAKYCICIVTLFIRVLHHSTMNKCVMYCNVQLISSMLNLYLQMTLVLLLTAIHNVRNRSIVTSILFLVYIIPQYNQKHISVSEKAGFYRMLRFFTNVIRP